MSFFQFNNVKISGIVSAVPNQKQAVDLQTASDLGFAAAENLLTTKNTDRNQLGFIIFLTKTPDYRSPASAIVLQHRLQLPIDCLAYDVNLGAVGFIAGLQLGCSLLNGLNTSKGLVIIGDTNSKQLEENNPLLNHFGDAATAILLEKQESSTINLQVFSQGNNYDSYIIAGGAFRTTENRKDYELSSIPAVADFNKLVYDTQKMNQFFAEKIPTTLLDFISKTNSQVADFDSVAFQQSNLELNSELAQKAGFDLDKLQTNSEDFGNVAGASIPLLLLDNKDRKRVLACAYGEGLSWGFADFYIEKETILPLIKTDEYFTEGFVTHEM